VEIWSGQEKADQIDWSAASDPVGTYNCFGFALGYNQWWEPPVFIDELIANEEAIWPLGLSESLDIDNYIAAARTERFYVSQDAMWEESCDTIMLYFTTNDRKFQHAARQVSSGVWSSKLGTGSDITHAIDGIDRIDFGTGRIYMKRAIQSMANAAPETSASSA